MAGGRSKRRRLTCVDRPSQTWDEDPAASLREAELAARARDAFDGEAAFSAYYRDAQRIARDDADWDALMVALRSPLPVAFRMSRVAGRQAEVTAALAEAAPLLAASHPLGARGSRVAPPARHFAWANAWQLGCDGKALRQAAKHAPESALAALGRWIVKHNASGVLTRQELVSMVRCAETPARRARQRARAQRPAAPRRALGSPQA
jgi:16S rRNA C967 or C1407 C5-methylase (RsmB/RsmF family)